MADLRPSDPSLLVALHDRASEVRRPVHGTVEITNRCQLACSMCYVRVPARDRAAQAEELSAEQWVTVLREAVDAGTVFLTVTGGEPFLRADLFDILDPLSTLGVSLTLFTNATLITRRHAQRLRLCPPAFVDITLYGATAGTYEAVTGVAGSYERCLRGIDALLEQGIRVTLKATLTTINVAEADAMRAVAERRGVPFRASWLLTPRRDGGESGAHSMRCSARQVVDLEARDRASLADLSCMASTPADDTDGAGLYCSAGRSSYHIGADGRMGICMDLPEPGIKPLEVGFERAWQELVRWADGVGKAQPCAQCEVLHYCPRCPAFALLETGDMAGAVPYLCEVAHERARRFGQVASS